MKEKIINLERYNYLVEYYKKFNDGVYFQFGNDLFYLSSYNKYRCSGTRLEDFTIYNPEDESDFACYNPIFWYNHELGRFTKYYVNWNNNCGSTKYNTYKYATDKTAFKEFKRKQAKYIRQINEKIFLPLILQHDLKQNEATVERKVKI